MNERFVRAYKTIALHWLNTTLLLVALVAGASLFFRVLDTLRPARYVWRYNAEALKSVRRAEANEIFERFAGLNNKIGLTYRPWVGLSERPVHYPRVNVDADDPLPIRRTPPPERGSGNAEKVVWLFGGSTTFGVGVPDDQTLAAHLQRALDAAYPNETIRVVNCGHVRYFSSQEVALFVWMLRHGPKPHLALFLDGLNDSWHLHDAPDYSDEIERLVPAYGRQPAVSISPQIGIVRFALALLRGQAPANDLDEIEHLTGADLARVVPMIGARYLNNVHMARGAGAASSTHTLFIWQPTPFDFIEQPADQAVARIRSSWPSNRMMKPLNAWIAPRAREENVCFLADAFGSRRFLETYVDSCHYGDASGAELAQRIAKRIVDTRALQ
jgi:hypothetical protein